MPRYPNITTINKLSDGYDLSLFLMNPIGRIYDVFPPLHSLWNSRGTLYKIRRPFATPHRTFEEIAHHLPCQMLFPGLQHSASHRAISGRMIWSPILK